MADIAATSSTTTLTTPSDQTTETVSAQDVAQFEALLDGDTTSSTQTATQTAAVEDGVNYTIDEFTKAFVYRLAEKMMLHKPKNIYSDDA